MKTALTYLSLVNLVFVLLLAVSGGASGVFGEVLYILAFLLPIAASLYIIRRCSLSFEPPRVKLSRADAALTLSLTAPTISLVFLISYLTDKLVSLFADQNLPDVSGPLFAVLISNALITPILEEMLFRYIPLALLSPYSRRGAVIYSSVFFALVHCNIFQLPYALIAGIIFAVLTLITGSIIPSIIIHSINNVVSVFWIRYGENASFLMRYLIVLGIFTFVSLPFVFIFRKRILKGLSDAFKAGERGMPAASFIVFAAAMLIASLLSL